MTNKDVIDWHWNNVPTDGAQVKRIEQLHILRQYTDLCSHISLHNINRPTEMVTKPIHRWARTLHLKK